MKAVAIKKSSREKTVGFQEMQVIASHYSIPAR
jgi:hypothetical protein